MPARDPAFVVVPSLPLQDAAPLLAAVATFLEEGNVDAAMVALRTIDVEACDRYWKDSAKEVLSRHRKEAHASRRKGHRKNVSKSWKVEIGTRDGWRCRYCGLRVVAPGFFRALAAALPDEFPPAPVPMEGTSWPIYRLFDASPDHIIPVSAGGEHSLENLVTSCGACNYQAKGDCTLEELGLVPPEPPLPDESWDGLLGRPATAK
jgi:hypothetical protein